MSKDLDAIEVKEIFKGLVVFVICVFFAIIFISMASTAIEPTESTKIVKLTLDDIVDNAITISYDELFRNNKNYIGKPITYEAQIVQVIQGSSHYEYRLDITMEFSSYDRSLIGYSDTIYAHYKTNTRFLEGDIVKLYGTVEGLQTYKSIMGAKITLPKIQILKMDVISKAGYNDYW